MDTALMEKYMRVASLSIALYDYIITLPAEWRFYRSQYRNSRLCLACILFISIRYASVMVMVISNYGVFSTSFTQESCQRYYLVSPIFKVLQTMASHAILGVRTFNITRRSRRMGTILLVSFVVATGLEWFNNLYNRIPVVLDGNCTAGNPRETAWIYYVVVMLYDLGTLTVSTVYLIRHNAIDGRFSRLIKTMLYDGLGYFVALTAVNIFNVILYHSRDEGLQSSGASLGYVVTWIMSQRILIHLRVLDRKGTSTTLL
ncbi:hypothetical protein PAXRUDRAFT_311174 [Paxillus rubicundulus Ve08.2h10]|uniref:DUF6533 domain-containing protein n=1 Tax=Paxillus rubicundulus Ve08.2h10 TaxID=930991 RepID=A0A0D0C6P1_9AGAM|nr:hypothetical protein PAXRUDRAFT_311174 [Paxillus rubicundulus Ve08.2h10]